MSEEDFILCHQGTSDMPSPLSHCEREDLHLDASFLDVENFDAFESFVNRYCHLRHNSAVLEIIDQL